MKYLIKYKLPSNSIAEEVVEADSLEEAEEMARLAWFDLNEPYYEAEEISNDLQTPTV